MKILSYDGLAHFWEKVKEYVDGKTNPMPIEYASRYDSNRAYMALTAKPGVLYYCNCGTDYTVYPFTDLEHLDISLDYSGVTAEDTDAVGDKIWLQTAEYCFELRFDDTVPEITLPEDVQFLEEPVFEPNTRYHISIVNDLALVVGFPIKTDQL